MTHHELCLRAKKWLANSQGCSVVVVRSSMAANEQPDAIGWTQARKSILVECKVSRSDFFRDRKKSFRVRPASGMGTLRYYLTPPKLVTLAEVPEAFGLLECCPSVIRCLKKSPWHSEKSLHEEITHLLNFINHNDTREMPDGIFACVG